MIKRLLTYNISAFPAAALLCGLVWLGDSFISWEFVGLDWQACRFTLFVSMIGASIMAIIDEF